MKTKGRAMKVYSINREKLKEAIKILDEVSSRYKTMLKETETTLPVKNVSKEG